MLGERGAWPVAVRTAVIDQLILAKIAAGTDAVINLGAGLDARPWRLPLPRSLPWIEIDLPDVLDYKRQKLLGHPPSCAVAQIALDLLDRQERTRRLEEIAGAHRRTLVCSEGLLAYWHEAQVEALAIDLRAQESIRSWIFDFISPAVLEWLQKELGEMLRAANAEMRYAPGGMELFVRTGWEVEQLRWVSDDAARLGREPWSGKILRATLWAARGKRREALQRRVLPGIALLRQSSDGLRSGAETPREILATTTRSTDA
jgi:methyltransferase (TIGR00027 family)